ncbi:hypothetical protein R3P38DRAFT_492763 [Favolaschia claudopus]|uniref:Zn(2)-C6 fungal-type domain-containing protein n=1 Tax=Favolaschia claudopus TaxID=2862362 RepID=A0AAW0CJR3_9AGAR
MYSYRLQKASRVDGAASRTTDMLDASTPPVLIFMRRRANIACQKCRKRKVRCISIGGPQDPCKRCVNKGFECHYPPVGAEDDGPATTSSPEASPTLSHNTHPWDDVSKHKNAPSPHTVHKRETGWRESQNADFSSPTPTRRTSVSNPNHRVSLTGSTPTAYNSGRIPPHHNHSDLLRVPRPSPSINPALASMAYAQATASSEYAWHQTLANTFAYVQ